MHISNYRDFHIIRTVVWLRAIQNIINMFRRIVPLAVCFEYAFTWIGVSGAALINLPRLT